MLIRGHNITHGFMGFYTVLILPCGVERSRWVNPNRFDGGCCPVVPVPVQLSLQDVDKVIEEQPMRYCFHRDVAGVNTEELTLFTMSAYTRMFYLWSRVTVSLSSYMKTRMKTLRSIWSDTLRIEFN